MAFDPGKGWEKKGDDLFIHDSGVRISKSAYRGKLGWWVLPLDLNVAPTEFPPTDEGRADAFATFAKGLPKAKPQPKPKVDTKKRKIIVPVEEDTDAEPGEGPANAEPVPEKDQAEADEDEEDEDEDEDEEKETPE